MKPRPLSVAVIGWTFIAAGLVGLAHHAPEFHSTTTAKDVDVLILLIRILAILGGAYLLLGANWARSLLVGWLGYHVFLSARHSTLELALHAPLLAVIVYFLFREPAASYFRGATNANHANANDE
jgi:hypothetical protein